MSVANHVAIIMDGNGRWALQKGKSRNYGHQQGLKTIEKIVDYSIKKKISYLTLFTFSSENWKRPKSEINFLFKLIQATAVEPEPIQLSKTTSFSLEYVFIKYSIISIGFCVGCHFCGLSLLITANFCIERGYLSVVVPSLPNCVEI